MTDYTKEIEEILEYYESDGSNITGEKALADLLALIHSAQREERERITKEILDLKEDQLGVDWVMTIVNKLRR